MLVALWCSLSRCRVHAGLWQMTHSQRPCTLAATVQVLDMAGKLVAPGVTTDEIDRAVHAMTIENGAYPSPLNYGA